MAAIPQTADEARKQGYEVRSLTPEEARRIIGSSQSTEAIPPDCSRLPPGRICWEGDCIDGIKEVLYCEGNFCTGHATVRC